MLLWDACKRPLSVTDVLALLANAGLGPLFFAMLERPAQKMDDRDAAVVTGDVAQPIWVLRRATEDSPTTLLPDCECNSENLSYEETE